MEIKCIQTGILRVNTYIVPTEDGKCFVVDPAACRYSLDTERFFSFIEGTGLEPVAVVLTHGHFDHVSGLKFMKEKYPEIRIFIHGEDSMMIGQDSGRFQEPALMDMGLESFVPCVSDLPEASDYLSDGEKIFGLWRIMHTPGHTKGSCCLYNEKDGMLLSGDTLFYRSWGRTDFEGGSEVQMMLSLSRIKENVPGSVFVYPGHEYYGFELKDGI